MTISSRAGFVSCYFYFIRDLIVDMFTRCVKWFRDGFDMGAVGLTEYCNVTS